MKETDLTTKLAERFRKTIRNSIVFKHADSYTHGIPDISVTAHGHTSWWEIKYANPKFASTGIQELNCLKLARVSICYYVIFDNAYNMTRIVHPFQFKDWDRDMVAFTSGFNYDFVSEWAEKRHR